MASRSETIEAALNQLVSNNSTDITGAAVISLDGMLLGARMAPDVNPDRVGAIAATMMGVTLRVVNDLKIGHAEEAIIKADNGYLLVMPINAQMVIATTMRANANLGMVRLETRDTSRSLGSVLGA